MLIVGNWANRGNPPLDSFPTRSHCHSRSNLVEVAGEGGSVYMRRIKFVVEVLALVTMLVAMTAAPAMADENIDSDCFPLCENVDVAVEDVAVDVEGEVLVDIAF